MIPRWIFPPLFALTLLTGAPSRADPIPLSALSNCGTEIENGAFARPDYWHGLIPCLRDLRNAWNKAGPMTPVDMEGAPSISDLVRTQILAEMGKAHTRLVPAKGEPLPFAEAFGPDLTPLQPLERLILVNDLGEPYNGMGQAELGYMLYSFAAQAGEGGYPGAGRDMALYRLLGRLSFQTMLTDVSQGGLASWHACDVDPKRDCVWYHSITRRDEPAAAGATLNQMLHVIRYMEMASALLDREGWSEPFDLDTAAGAGLDQFFLTDGHEAPGTMPNLADFVGLRSADGAWAFYGFDPRRAEADGPGYFLDDPERNLHYHQHVLDLMGEVLDWARAQGRNAEALRAADAPDSVLAQFRQASASGQVPAFWPRRDKTATPELDVGGNEADVQP